MSLLPLYTKDLVGGASSAAFAKSLAQAAGLLVSDAADGGEPPQQRRCTQSSHGVAMPIDSHEPETSTSGTVGLAAVTAATAPAGRSMTTQDLLSYARGMAAWLPAAAASTSASPLPPDPPTGDRFRDLREGKVVEVPRPFHKRTRQSAEGPYDICPPDLAPSTSYASASKAPPAGGGRAVGGLPAGVVLLKGFLSMSEQIKIVQAIRDLGLGPGGFYTPSYSSGGRLSLRMMCLGLHWEPRTSKYEATRSAHDGATPPPIPPWLAELCGRCLAAATTAAASPAAGGGGGGGASRLPAMHPDICLANFYERSGRLGMHQDKDEMADSLRAGLPVVSLSLGDAADFLYGRTRDAEEASSVRLESGDLLVFGGPGRMIFHSVAKIHPNTAPAELVRATGLRPGRLNLTFRQYRAGPQ